MAKLNTHERLERKDLRKFLDATSVTSGRTVVTGRITGQGQGWFAVYICSPREKFNRKRGELITLQRLYRGSRMPLEFDETHSFKDVLSYIAEAVQTTT